MCHLIQGMQRRNAPIGLLGLLIAVLVLLSPGSTSAGEREIWKLWQIHLEGLDQHPAVVKACRNYTAAYPSDAFLPVVQSIEAWHLLHAGKKSDAIRLLSQQLKSGDEPLARGAQRVARGWVTRLQRERVVDALQHFYRKEVRYPVKLEALKTYPGLPAAEKLPTMDAWGKPWRYRLAGFEGVPGFRDQKYTLESTFADPPWEMAAALAAPYAHQMNVTAAPVARNTRESVSTVKLEFLDGEAQSKTAVGQVGGTVENLTVAYAGKGLVILCDTLHWKILTWKK